MLLALQQKVARSAICDVLPDAGTDSARTAVPPPRAPSALTRYTNSSSREI